LVLSYWFGKSVADRRVYLVVAGGGAPVEVLDLGAAEPGRRLYRDAVAAVAQPGGDPWPALDAASDFFVPAALRPALRPGRRVVVSVDAAIGELPFEALRVDGVPIGTTRVVYRAPSLAVFDRLRSRPRRAGRALVLDSAAPPDGERELHGLSSLEFSAAEASLVLRFHPTAVRLHGAQATLAQLRAQLGDGLGDGLGAGPGAGLGAGLGALRTTAAFSLLHISAHAINHPGIPSASLLMLSDGAVDMATLATLPLADMLVVFSACQSAGARRAGGEGVKGLLWGPLSAGARAVVASLWQVNQQATKDLMGQFHFQLGRGVSEGEAMRRARQTLSGAANYAHPSYWAGFAVYGVPGVAEPAAVGRGWWWSWWLGGGVVLALAWGGARLLRRRAGATPRAAVRRRP
jgi:hypothetical protein